MVVCVHLPRFELIVAAERSEGALGGRAVTEQMLAGRALAVAPVLGTEQRVGEVSGAAEAYGVARGMGLGEALARCPDLLLVPGDPVGVSETWERAMCAIESIGGAVEPAGHTARSAGSGLAYFETDGLRGLHGTDAATITAARRAVRSAIGRSVHVGAGPTRFCAMAAALAGRSRRPLVVDEHDGGLRAARRWLAGQPVGLLGYREETESLPASLDRLGVRTLGELARLGRASLADRFGAAGVLAHRLACVEDTRLRVRPASEPLEEAMGVGDASSGPALERVLGVLVDRLLA
jgi:protein ImuB